MNNTIKKLEKSIEFYNALIQQSTKSGDPQIYISFLEGQVVAYENILKEIKKERREQNVRTTKL